MRSFDLSFFQAIVLAWRSVDWVNRTLSNQSQDFLHRVCPGLLPSLRNQCFRVLRDTTHLRYNSHNCHCILVVACSSFSGMVLFFQLFVELFANLTLREQTLISCFTSRNVLLEWKIGKMPILTRRSSCKHLPNSICTVSKNDTRITFALNTSFPRPTSTSCHWWLRRYGGIVVWFLCRIVTLMPATALVSFQTLAFFFPLVTGAYSSFNAIQFHSILDHYSCFNSPVSGVKVSLSKFLI